MTSVESINVQMAVCSNAKAVDSTLSKLDDADDLRLPTLALGNDATEESSHLEQQKMAMEEEVAKTEAELMRALHDAEKQLQDIALLEELSPKAELQTSNLDILRAASSCSSMNSGIAAHCNNASGPSSSINTVRLPGDKGQRATSMHALPIESPNPANEFAALTEMRKELAEDLKGVPDFEELKGDVRLLRFLRGYRLNVQQACKSYRAMLESRKQHGLDKIREELVAKQLRPESFPHFALVQKHIPFANLYNTFDRQGNVIVIERTGAINKNGLVAELGYEKLFDYFKYELEYRSIQLDRHSREKERLVRVIEIRDLKDINPAVLDVKTLNFLNLLFSFMQINYPESTAYIFASNAPMWKLLVTVIPAAVIQKIQIKDEKKTKAELPIYIDKDVLPTYLGGNNEAKLVPETGLLAPPPFQQLLNEGGTSVSIGRGASERLAVLVPKGGSLRWEFACDGYDLDFTLKECKQGDGEAIEEVLIPTQRYQPYSIVAGTWKAEKDTRLALIFSNSYSWVRGKEVAYKTTITKPTGEEETVLKQ